MNRKSTSWILLLSQRANTILKIFYDFVLTASSIRFLKFHLCPFSFRPSGHIASRNDSTFYQSRYRHFSSYCFRDFLSYCFKAFRIFNDCFLDFRPLLWRNMAPVLINRFSYSPFMIPLHSFSFSRRRWISLLWSGSFSLLMSFDCFFFYWMTFSISFIFTIFRWIASQLRKWLRKFFRWGICGIKCHKWKRMKQSSFSSFVVVAMLRMHCFRARLRPR